MRDWTKSLLPLAARAAAGLAHFQEAERERAGLWLPVALAAGILIYFDLPVEPHFLSGPASLLCAIMVFLAVRQRALPAFLAGLLVVGAAGFTAAQVRTLSVEAPVLERGITAAVAGVVETVGMTPRGRRIILQVESLGRLPAEKLPGRARVLLLNRDQVPLPGSRIRVFGRFQPPPPPVSPHAYDFQRALFFEGIGAVGFALAPHSVEAAVQVPGYRGRVEELRQVLSERIRDRLSGDTGALAAALLVGDRDWISETAETAMRDAGIAHLLAISGLHMGLVAGCVFGFVRLLLSLSARTALLCPTRVIAAVAALAFATFYLLLSGAAVPTLRAYVMTAIVLGGIVLGRRAISMRLIAFAALTILLFRPDYLLSASFQLSFAAVTALVAVYETGYWSGATGSDGLLRKSFRHLLLLALTSLVASLATLPVALHHFQKAALYGVATNLLAVPAAGMWIMPWGVAALVLLPFGWEAVALVPMGWGLDLVLSLATEIQTWPFATYAVSAGPGWVAGAAALSGLWLCLWRSRWRYLGVAPLIVTSVLLLLSPWRPPALVISDRGRVIGVHAGSELATSSGRNGFEALVWRRRAGLREEGTGRRFDCDPLGCVFVAAGIGTVAWSSSAQSLAEDCLRADILVTRIRVPEGCSVPRLILGPRDLRPGGSIAVWFDGPRPRVVYARYVRGERPWTGRKTFPKAKKD
ncbi:ComEC/Rec2 family competence protein [Nisaea sediminum]|uniref:ComEC/Rec2 family competence protein n=1 Tax=Nisaea sediminum TaxID=2775867 RepID=UPI0018661420|nr:ComEC/Rec2 family competence protein [Nisaea sediminum]